MVEVAESSERHREDSEMTSQELESAARQVLSSGVAWAANYWPADRVRIRDDLRIIGRFPGRILEVGSAPYITTLALALSGRDVVGVDIDPVAVPHDIQVHRCDIEQEPLPVDDSSFDVVVLSDVFEHLRLDPIFTLGELRRVLRPDGVLLLTTPNLRSLRGILRLTLLGKAWAVGAYPINEYRKLSSHGFMGHVREYTAYEVRGMLEGCGFSVDRVIWRNKPGFWLWRAIELLVPPTRPYMTLIARPSPITAS